MKDGWNSNKGGYGINGDYSVNPQVDFATVPKLTPQQVAQAKWEATVTVSSPALKSRGETLDKAEYENACEFYGVEAKQEPTAEGYEFVPSGSVVVPEEQVIPEGYKAVPQNAQVVQEGEKVVPKDAQIVQEGEKVVSKDAQVVQEDEIAVKKESIQAAKAETISVADGVVTLNVNVCSNGNFTAETSSCEKAKITDVKLNDDGTVTLTVPVSSASAGFMILQSKDAKVNSVPDKIIEDR